MASGRGEDGTGRQLAQDGAVDGAEAGGRRCRHGWRCDCGDVVPALVGLSWVGVMARLLQMQLRFGGGKMSTIVESGG